MNISCILTPIRENRVLNYEVLIGGKNMKNIAVVSGARLLRALGNEKRLEIVCHLMDGELKVHELEELIGLSQSALSQHLAVLRSEKVVKTRREAQNIFYSLNSEQARKIVEVLQLFYK